MATKLEQAMNARRAEAIAAVRKKHPDAEPDDIVTSWFGSELIIDVYGVTSKRYIHIVNDDMVAAETGEIFGKRREVIHG